MVVLLLLGGNWELLLLLPDWSYLGWNADFLHSMSVLKTLGFIVRRPLPPPVVIVPASKVLVLLLLLLLTVMLPVILLLVLLLLLYSQENEGSTSCGPVKNPKPEPPLSGHRSRSDSRPWPS